MKKKILIVVGIVIILAIGIALYMFMPMLLMTPAETGVVPGTNILAIRNARNAVYFMETPEGYILVDTGSGPESLKRSMEEQKIPAESVKWVLLTHSDYDHVGSLELFTGAEIFEPSAADGVAEGDLTLGGVSISRIKTPGHRPNHTSYLVDGKYLFTGDAFKYKDGAFSVHPFSDDAAESEKSIEILKDVMANSESELVLTGHYGYFIPQKKE